MAHARILRSPVAHAKLAKVDASKAKAFPGVIATLTRDDIQAFNYKYGATYKDQSIVAVDKVRYVGDPVAAVLADDPATAEAALELIEVEYEELPKVTNIEEATAPGAALVHEAGVARAELRGSVYGAPERFNGTNICYYLTFAREDVTKGFAKADHIFEDTFRFQKVQHYSLEAHNNIVYYDGEKLTVWASCQDPFTLRDHLSGIFRLPLSRIRVIVPYVGGGYADAGPRVTQKAAYRSLGPYKIPYANVEAYGVYTNTVPAGAFRGFGALQVTWAYESQMDMIAERLGLDPLEFRLKNLLKKGDVYTVGDTPVDCDLKEGLMKVADAIKWKEKSKKPNRAKGISCCIKDAGGTYKVAGATVKMSSDGSVVLLTGTVEIGQGPRTALSQVVAEELSLPMDQITVAQLDTDVTPYDISTSASSSMVVMGTAVQRAAQDAKKQLLQCAAKVLKQKASNLRLHNGHVVVGERPVISFSKVIVDFFGSKAGEIIGKGLYKDKRNAKAVLGSTTTFWEVGWGGVEVEVDPDTGVIHLLKYVSACDTGKAINPEQCIGQDEGAVMFGIGHTLMEEMVYEDGQLLNGNLVDYTVPRFNDVPDNLDTILIENGNGPGPFGSKGIGEGGLLPVASAIANAVSRAVGVRIQELPLTPPKIWRALQAKA